MLAQGGLPALARSGKRNGAKRLGGRKQLGAKISVNNHQRIIQKKQSIPI